MSSETVKIGNSSYQITVKEKSKVERLEQELFGRENSKPEVLVAGVNPVIVAGINPKQVKLEQEVLVAGVNPVIVAGINPKQVKLELEVFGRESSRQEVFVTRINPKQVRLEQEVFGRVKTKKEVIVTGIITTNQERIEQKIRTRIDLELKICGESKGNPPIYAGDNSEILKLIGKMKG